MTADIVDITTPGWEGVNADSPLPLQQTETENAELDRALVRIFETDDGERVMQYFFGAYLNQPTWSPGYDSEFGYYREGQNALIRELINRAERARER